MLPIGSTQISSPLGASADSLVLHPNLACPFTRKEHEPQTALRQEQRKVNVPSISSRILISASSTVAKSGKLSTM